MEQEVAEARLLVVDSLAVGMLLGTAFINKNIKRVFPKWVAASAGTSPGAANTQKYATLAVILSEDHYAHTYGKQLSLMLSVVIQEKITGLSKTLVLGKEKADRLQFSSTHHKVMRRKVVLFAQGVLDVVFDCSIVIKIAICSKYTITLPIEMVVVPCFQLYTVEDIFSGAFVNALRLYNGRES